MKRCLVAFVYSWFLLLAAVPGASYSQGTVRHTSGVVNQGTPWETPYYVQQSERGGPTVLVVGGVHGDEPAGAAAAEQIRHWPIARGTLVVLPRANPPALAAHTRTMPGVGKDLADLNRDFPKARQPGPGAGRAAQGIWAWVGSLHPGWLIDLHEGFGVRQAGSKSVGSSVIVSPSPEGDAAAKEMLRAVNATIEDPGQRFVLLRTPRDGSLARAAAGHLGVRAAILETSMRHPPSSTATEKPQPLSKRVRQHRLMVGVLLKHLGMIDSSLDVDQLAGRRAAPEKTWVALYDAGGTGGRGASCVERILRAGGMQVVRVGPEEIAAGALAQFDVAVVPGGSASKEAAALGNQGRDRLRRFVENGGGYVGICAGGYLCTAGFDWSLKILDARTASPLWRRGVGTVKIELTPEGRRILGDRGGLLDVHYASGPIITRAAGGSLPDYEVLAVFRTELAKNGTPAGLMTNSPAIAVGRYGQGRVVLVSPHPEQTPDLEDFVLQAAAWAAGKR